MNITKHTAYMGRSELNDDNNRLRAFIWLLNQSLEKDIEFLTKPGLGIIANIQVSVINAIQEKMVRIQKEVGI